MNMLCPLNYNPARSGFRYIYRTDIKTTLIVHIGDLSDPLAAVPFWPMLKAQPSCRGDQDLFASKFASDTKVAPAPGADPLDQFLAVRSSAVNGDLLLDHWVGNKESEHEGLIFEENNPLIVNRLPPQWRFWYNGNKDQPLYFGKAARTISPETKTCYGLALFTCVLEYHRNSCPECAANPAVAALPIRLDEVRSPKQKEAVSDQHNLAAALFQLIEMEADPVSPALLDPKDPGHSPELWCTLPDPLICALLGLFAETGEIPDEAVGERIEHCRKALDGAVPVDSNKTTGMPENWYINALCAI